MPFQSLNPATGKLIESFATLSDDDVQTVIARAQKAFESTWRKTPINQRAAAIARAAEIMRAKAEELAAHIVMEIGKRVAEARVEVELVASIFDYYAKTSEAHIKPRPVPDAQDAFLHVEPIGIILAIEPWNFPYYQAARVVAPQLMVGNVVILKHAENCPRCALAFADILEEAGVPDGVFTNIFASIEQVGRIIDDPRVRGVTLTGSERAGAAVAERAGRNLKKVVMELGGSDALIVLEDAPLDWAIGSAVVGRMANAGQSCIGTKRIIVVGKKRGAAFLTGIKQKMGSMVAGDPSDEATHLGPLSSQRALSGLLSQIEKAKSSGATVELGGSRIDRPGFYLEPTILTNVTSGNPAYAEEFFGPVVQLHVVDTQDDAVALANATPFGLGGSVFTADEARGLAVAQQIDSGMVCINQPFKTAANLPFGGTKNSGFGRELAQQGLDEFVNKKLITTAPAGAPPRGPYKR
jgi:succinate-semialdehyde dehydrogenase/glutarate-semialdehyde dehydrogenase